MPPIPGAHVACLQNPARYTDHQLRSAAAIAYAIHRGQFVLCTPPRRNPKRNT